MTPQAEAIFSSVARAVADAQERLDAASPKGATQYSIPRVDAEHRFRIQLRGGSVVFFFFRREGESPRSAHSLRYSLIADPERPRPAPERPLAIELRTPPYLLPADLEQEIGAEAERFAGVSPKPAKGDDQGLVCFRLAGPLRYFVVRVAQKPDKDAVYLFDPGGAAVPQSKQRYGAFDALFQTIRAARQSAPRMYPYQLEMPVGWGWDRFHVFLTQLWTSYVEATKELAARTPAGDPPVFYRIDDFRGAFFYSAWKAKSDDSALNSFDADDDWIHNHVAVRHDSRRFTAEVDLLAPEFVLSGDAHAELLDQIAAPEASAKIAEKFGDDLGVIVAAREFQRAPRDALILLSYENEPPTKGFLTVWSAAQGEFLFTFDSDGEKVKKGLEAHAFIPAGAESTAEISKGAYKVIHNFLRAVRLWRTRTIKT